MDGTGILHSLYCSRAIRENYFVLMRPNRFRIKSEFSDRSVTDAVKLRWCKVGGSVTREPLRWTKV